MLCFVLVYFVVAFVCALLGCCSCVLFAYVKVVGVVVLLIVIVVCLLVLVLC